MTADVNSALVFLATIRGQLEAVGAAAAKDLKSIERKEEELSQKHRDQLDELRKAREAHDELEESGHFLDEELDAVTEALRGVQQRIEEKVRGTSDSQVDQMITLCCSCSLLVTPLAIPSNSAWWTSAPRSSASGRKTENYPSGSGFWTTS